MTDHDALARRIDELEAEVQRLREDAARPHAARPPAGDAVSRRRLLGRAGVAAAAAAGALASPAFVGRAAAADDDNLVLGNPNTATSETSLTRSAAGAALVLENTSTGVPIRLLEADPDTVEAGDVFLDPFGYFWGAFDIDAAGRFYDSSFAAFPILIEPFRMLDTRQAGATATNFGRSRVTNPTGKFDANGRLRAGTAIDVRLDDFSEFAYGAIVNVTVTGPAGGGFLRSWPTSFGPVESSIINYATNQTIANGLTLPIGFDASDRDSITIACSQNNTHVIVDISGLVVGDPSSFVGFFGTGAASASVQRQRFARRRGPNAARVT